MPAGAGHVIGIRSSRLLRRRPSQLGAPSSTAQQPQGVQAEVDRADGEQDVTGDAQPDQGFHHRRVDDLRRAGVPQALADRGPGLVDAGGQQRQEHHHGQADVQAPVGGLEQRVGVQVAGIEAAQAEQHQADAQHAVHTEQGGVAVGGGHVQALHVVERGRRVDREAQQAGTDGVPEGHGHEAQHGPLVRGEPGRLASASRSAGLPGRSGSAAPLPARRTRRRRRSRRWACRSSTGGAGCPGCRRTGTRWSRRRWRGWRWKRAPGPAW